MVTVGSFNSYGRELPDGTVQYDPQIVAIIQQYQGQPIANQQKSSYNSPMVLDGVKVKTFSVPTPTYQPVVINGVECDAQPQIIEVPRCRR
jgi:hypothetical protein